MGFFMLKLQGVFSQFNRLRIRTRIMIFYLILVILSILVSVFIYTSTSSYYLQTRIHELTLNEIASNDKSLEVLLEDVSNDSKTLISNQRVQEVLGYGDLPTLEYRGLDRELAEFINFNNKMSSIYVFNMKGQRYYTEKIRFKDFALADIQTMPWYQELMDKRGGYVININGAGLIPRDEGLFLTFVRVINSNDFHNPIGILVINIPVEMIRQVLNLDDESFFIFHELNTGTELRFNIEDGWEYEEYFDRIHSQNRTVFSQEEHVNQMNYIVTGKTNDRLGWELLRGVPLKNQSKQVATFNVAVLTIILVNGCLIIVGSWTISEYITTPLKDLTHAMKNVECGTFEPVEVYGEKDEISALNSGYNYMIIRIQELIEKVIEEQETIKHAEFRVIMEQIKPHFMYNTLDSISSLVMLERTEEAYESLRALAKFYRKSLSDGRTMITIGTEIDIIKNYLFIQKIRYQHLFEVIYTIDETLLDVKIPKLILQPLVENSIYHGIRPMGEQGIIEVSVLKEDTWIYLKVWDNGCGMKNEEIENLLQRNQESDSSVGIPATRRRIMNMYGDTAIFDINSDEGGTCITIGFDLKKSEERGEV